MPDPSAVEVATSGSDPPASNGSSFRAVAVAVGLGLLGPFIAVVSAGGIGAVNLLFELPLIATVVLGLFFGQYVAFAGLAVAYLSTRGLDFEGIRSYLGVRMPTLRELGLVVASWLAIAALLVVVSLVVRGLGAEPAENQSAELAMQNPAIIPLFIVAMFLVVGPCEEILYRGVVQGRLRESLSALPSIVIASTVFAFIHVIALTGGVTARLTTVAILFVPSLVFGAVYEHTENIVVPSLLHGLHNAVLFTLLYVSLTHGEGLQSTVVGVV